MIIFKRLLLSGLILSLTACIAYPYRGYGGGYAPTYYGGAGYGGNSGYYNGGGGHYQGGHHERNEYHGGYGGGHGGYGGGHHGH